MKPTASNIVKFYVCLTGDIKPNNNKGNPVKSKTTQQTTSKVKRRNDSERRQDQQRQGQPNFKSSNASKSKPIHIRGEGSTSFSSCSICCRRSAGSSNVTSAEACLSTILKLDKEHNMFGLSNMAMVGSKVSRKIHKKNDKPAFPQKTIVQVCCSKKCTKSKTDLPMSLKCGGCRGCYKEPNCVECCSVPKIPCKMPCIPKCVPAQLNSDGYYHGMKISFKRKQIFEPPPPIVLTPRSSCILTKPLAARSCHHVPKCTPPSSCFPYLMPCYWPARPDAPCSNPERCFHNPPCPRRKSKMRTKIGAQMCPKGGCSSEKNKCPVAACSGNIPSLKNEIQSRFGKDNKQF